MEEIIMPRTVRACIFSSIFPTDEDRFRLVFLEHCNGEPLIFQTTLRNLSNAEVATGFWLLYNFIRAVEEIPPIRVRPKIVAVVTDDVGCFKSRNFSLTIENLGIIHLTNGDIP